MTLEEVVVVLNAEQHNGHTDWREQDCHVTNGADDLFTAFEAVAVAEKYLRELPDDDPAETPETTAAFLAMVRSWPHPSEVREGEESESLF